MRVASCLMLLLVGCWDNHAPIIELPAEPLTVKENWYTRFDVTATDPDGDNLSFAAWASGGSLTLYSVRPQDDGTIKAVVGYDAPGHYFGESTLHMRVSDGSNETEVEFPITITPVNDDPVGTMDIVATSADTPVVIYASTLLANDTDLDAEVEERVPDELSVKAVGKPNHGTVSLANGAITFVPETGFAGTGRFEYSLTDGVKTIPVTVLVNIGGPNAAPVAKDDMQTVMEGDTLHLRPPTLTRNDIDDDAESLQIISVGPAMNGTVTVENGWVTVMHDRLQPVKFTYTVTDGAATATGTVTVEVAPWL